jgi:hypothetical protein
LNLKRLAKLLVGLPLTLFVLLAAAQAARSRAQPAITLAAEAGFDGYYKDNHLVPVRVTVENSGPDLEASLQIRLRRQNNSETVYQQPVSLPTTSRKAFTLYIFPESFFVGSNLGVSLRVDEREVAATNARLDSIRSTDRLYGILAGDPSAFNLLAAIEPSNRQAFVAQLRPEALPDHSAALEALDVIIVSDLDGGLIPPAAARAMRDWVSEGGHLLVSGGQNWRKTAQGLGELLPLSPNNAANIDDLEVIQDFAKARAALDGPLFVSTGRLAPQAEILIGDVDLPLVARSRFGQGTVTYLGMDPSQQPLKNWEGLESFWRELLQTSHEEPSWLSGIQYFESAAQAVATLPNLPAPSAWLFCGFLGLYVAALGPANYFLLRKFKRRELAWLSIPGLVILFSVLAVITGSRMRGTQPILNRMAVVQAWPQAGHARVDGLVGLFSPRRATYRLELDPPFLAHPIPSENPVSGGSWIVQQGSERVAVPEIRTEVGALQAVSVRGTLPTPEITHDLEFRPEQGAAALEGTVTNQSGLNFRDAVLIAYGQVQHLGELMAGGARDIRLTNLDAAPADQTAPDPGPDPGAPPGRGPLVFEQEGDFLTMQILGTSAFFEDRETYRRYLLLDSLWSTAPADAAAGDGVYLLGWTDAAAIPAEISGQGAKSVDLTLYIIALNASTQESDSGR